VNEALQQILRFVHIDISTNVGKIFLCRIKSEFLRFRTFPTSRYSLLETQKHISDYPPGLFRQLRFGFSQITKCLYLESAYFFGYRKNT